MTILEGLSKVTWPLVILFILIKYAAPISELIRSLSKRKMVIKVGDKHITLDEASEQQVELITDLRREILDLRNEVRNKEQEPYNKYESRKTQLEKKSILWVDDQPQKHAYIIEHIKSLGFRIFLNSSTKEALDFLSKNTPDFVISDLGRFEKEGYDSLAGVHLAKEIRKRMPMLPVYIFSAAAEKVASDVEKGIISLATSSQGELIENLVLEAPNQANSVDRYRGG